MSLKGRHRPPRKLARHGGRAPGAPLGVTVISPAFEKCGTEAVRRFRAFTGLDVKVLRCRDEEGYATKLSLDKLAPRGPVVFFDADWWALRPMDLSSWPCGAVLAVSDHGVHDPGAFPCSDCERFSMDKSRYFNSGLMAWNNADPRHRALFAAARSRRAALQRKKPHLRPHDPGDQFYLNHAAQSLSVPVVLLPVMFNFYLHTVAGGCFPYIPRHIIGLHAAGVPVKRKPAHLRAAARVLSYDAKPMHEGAIRAHHAQTFELR